MRGFVLFFCAVTLARAGVVAGTVVDPADNEPVRKAIVTLTWQGHAARLGYQPHRQFRLVPV